MHFSVSACMDASIFDPVSTSRVHESRLKCIYYVEVRIPRCSREGFVARPSTKKPQEKVMSKSATCRKWTRGMFRRPSQLGCEGQHSENAPRKGEIAVARLQSQRLTNVKSEQPTVVSCLICEGSPVLTEILSPTVGWVEGTQKRPQNAVYDARPSRFSRVRWLAGRIERARSSG